MRNKCVLQKLQLSKVFFFVRFSSRIKIFPVNWMSLDQYPATWRRINRWRMVSNIEPLIGDIQCEGNLMRDRCCCCRRLCCFGGRFMRQLWCWKNGDIFISLGGTIALLLCSIRKVLTSHRSKSCWNELQSDHLEGIEKNSWRLSNCFGKVVRTSINKTLSQHVTSSVEEKNIILLANKRRKSICKLPWNDFLFRLQHRFTRSPSFHTAWCNQTISESKIAESIFCLRYWNANVDLGSFQRLVKLR